MKKAVAMLLVVACLCGMMSMTAFAATDSTAGVYDLTVTDGYTLTLKKADGTTSVTATTDVDGKKVYVGVERFELTYSGADAYYLVLVLDDTGTPTEKNIYYIDQEASQNGTVTFGIYPKQMQNDKTYHVYISSSSNAKTEVASFKYYQPYTLGDVNADGSITAADALRALQHASRKITLTGTEFSAADVDGNGSVTSQDALKILQRAAKKIQSFD